MDITVVNPLQGATIAQATTTPGFDRKVLGAADDCRWQGIAFLPLAAESFGGWHRN